jgi:hypothetical protein
VAKGPERCAAHHHRHLPSDAHLRYHQLALNEKAELADGLRAAAYMADIQAGQSPAAQEFRAQVFSG